MTNARPSAHPNGAAPPAPNDCDPATLLGPVFSAAFADTGTLLDLAASAMHLPAECPISPRAFLLRAHDPREYHALMTATVVGRVRDAPSPPHINVRIDIGKLDAVDWDECLVVPTPAASVGNRSSFRDNLDRAVEWLNNSSHEIADRMAAVETRYPNTIVQYLDRPEWRLLLKRVGDAFMFHLLTCTSIFVAVPRGYLQVTGPHFEEAAKNSRKRASESPVDEPSRGPKRLRPTSIVIERSESMFARAPASKRGRGNPLHLTRNHPLVSLDTSVASLRAVFPTQFTSKRGPHRLQAFLAIWNAAKASIASLTDRHVRRLLNAHCSAATQTATTLPLALATPEQHVSGFLQAVLDHIFPVGQTWGSEANHHHVVQGIRMYVQLRMEERVDVHDLMQGIKVTEIPWLGSGTNTGSTDEFEIRKRMLMELLHWLFQSLIVPLIRSHFFVTNSQPHRLRVFYYRHYVWSRLTRTEMKRHLAHRFVEIVPSNSGVTYHRHRLVPKITGTRLIMNQSKAIVIAPRSCRPWVSRSRYWEQRQILKVVGHRINAVNKAPLGAGLHKLADVLLHSRMVAFMKRIKVEPESNLYAVKVDIESAFDSIIPAKLVSLVESLLHDDEYVIQSYTAIRPDGTAKVETIYPRGQVPKFHRQLRNGDLAPPPRDVAAIYVDNVQYPSVARDKVVQTVASIAADSVIRGPSGKYYQQLSGIPQGGVLSPMLCNNETVARRFYTTMREGIAEYGCRVGADKSVTNLRDVKEMVWCGLLIDTKTKEIWNSYEKYFDHAISDALRVKTRNPLADFDEQIAKFYWSKFHSLLFDLSINRTLTVLGNAYQLALFAAIKTLAHLIQLSLRGVHARPIVVLRAIRAFAASLATRLIRMLASTTTTVQRAYFRAKALGLQWLALDAFARVLSHRREWAPVVERLRAAQRRVARRVPTRAGGVKAVSPLDRAVAADPRHDGMLARIKVHERSG
ncbi:hypothetical protein GGF31_008232 [Allomyces arbusculus]|nr:hypothetical protein GGF31_008232 [Allomyces arbusculus]